MAGNDFLTVGEIRKIIDGKSDDIEICFEDGEIEKDMFGNTRIRGQIFEIEHFDDKNKTEKIILTSYKINGLRDRILAMERKR